MGDVQGRNRRLADVGIDVAGQRAQPGIDGVDGLHHAGEVASLNDLLDQAQPFVRDARILVPDRDRGGDKCLSDQIGAELLQRGVGVDSLVAGVGVDQRRSSLVITSFRIAATDFRLANHCRRILVRSFVASALSSMIARVDQR